MTRSLLLAGARLTTPMALPLFLSQFPVEKTDKPDRAEKEKNEKEYGRKNTENLYKKGKDEEEDKSYEPEDGAGNEQGRSCEKVSYDMAHTYRCSMINLSRLTAARAPSPTAVEICRSVLLLQSPAT